MTVYDVVMYALLGLAVAGAAAMAFFGAVWVHQAVFAGIAEELDGDARGLQGIGPLLIRRLGVMNRHFLWPSYEAKLRKQLTKGGDPKGFQPEDILAMQEGGFVTGLAVGLIASASLSIHLGWSVLLAVLGAAYPLIWVSDQVKKRHLLISRALPYDLDLLTLSVEAGLDFTAALAKVVEKGKAGPLKDEFGLVLRQLKMGKTREESLKAMIARVDLPALSTFVTALIQADRMGTSLGKVLRIQSTQLRIDRTQRAEKLAGEAPVKMLFPLIACIFPTVFMILFGPIVFAFLFGNVGG